MDKQYLILQDIVIGDYVQEWSEIPCQFSMPMYVDGIFADGDLYLNFDGNEADPWEANVKDVYDIPVDFGILSHFGFFESDHHVWEKEVDEWQLTISVFKPLRTFIVKAILSNTVTGKIALSKQNLNSIRKVQHWFYEETEKPLKLNFE